MKRKAALFQDQLVVYYKLRYVRNKDDQISYLFIPFSACPRYSTILKNTT